MRIAVVGTGYLGATHAACMAELGYDVLGLDVDEAKVASLREGRLPFFEPDLEPLLRKHLESGRLRFTSSYAEAGAFGDVFFLCVGTPQRRNGLAADLSYLEAAVDGLAPHLDRPVLVAGKSTVPVGTAAGLAARLRAAAPAGDDVELAWNPEFLREGLAVEDTLRPDRLVLGVGSAAAEATLRELYAPIIDNDCPVIVTDIPTAELVKVSANAFLATKISFINAMAEIAEVAGADVTKLADAIGHDPRIGRRFLNAGLGFGGGCLPKDIRAFIARAGELGVGSALAFLHEVDDVNLRRRARVVEIARDLVGGSFTGKSVAVLGAAFKPDSDDIRDSPALVVAGQIHLQGASVTVYDPKAIENSRRAFPTLHYAGSVLEACQDVDVVLHLTEWAEFRSLDPARVREVVANPVVFDARNCLDADAWRAAGWTYRGFGRP